VSVAEFERMPRSRAVAITHAKTHVRVARALVDAVGPASIGVGPIALARIRALGFDWPDDIAKAAVQDGGEIDLVATLARIVRGHVYYDAGVHRSGGSGVPLRRRHRRGHRPRRRAARRHRAHAPRDDARAGDPREGRGLSVPAITAAQIRALGLDWPPPGVAETAGAIDLAATLRQVGSSDRAAHDVATHVRAVIAVVAAVGVRSIGLRNASGVGRIALARIRALGFDWPDDVARLAVTAGDEIDLVHTLVAIVREHAWCEYQYHGLRAQARRLMVRLDEVTDRADEYADGMHRLPAAIAHVQRILAAVTR
jgi:hypothetical protein